MKQVSILLLSLVSASVFAANTPALHAPKDMKVKKSKVSYSKRAPAQLSCNLYTLDTTVDDAPAKLVATGNSPILDVGSSYEMITKFPAPYDQVSVQFQHYTTAFYETGYEKFYPVISSQFWDEHGNFQAQDVSFDIDKARSGSSITLRGAAVADDNTDVYYQCSITFLK